MIIDDMNNMNDKEFNEVKEKIIKRIINEADRLIPIDGDLVVVTLQRYPNDEITDHVVCFSFPVGPPNVIIKGDYRNYEVLNWDWSDNTYGFVLKIIKPI